MSAFSTLAFISWAVFLMASFIGYGLCYFLITPFLLKKHRKMSLLKSAFWEGLQAENHLIDLLKETNDELVRKTLNTIKYSKIVAVFSIIAAMTFFVIEVFK